METEKTTETCGHCGEEQGHYRKSFAEVLCDECFCAWADGVRERAYDLDWGD